jgi:hypothetical protein
MVVSIELFFPPVVENGKKAPSVYHPVPSIALWGHGERCLNTIKAAGVATVTFAKAALEGKSSSAVRAPVQSK